ncbi:RbsD/FucU domain-containing protein [Homoserinibacter sp. GY 40078]|uniref:RbsD/FucU domain-containing protein n=1 Tax=Homoserinibacter sp. GY 40078 TaxID=2603275 RepID=UPI0016506E58|nr:RbsD/FucU domain-containing protein [Homoserinibacter sp. GY 40078]
MLKGIDPVLDGDVLRALDRLGHSDRLIVADAHFPAYRLVDHVITLAVDVPRAVRAVCSVIDLDTVDAAVMMDSGAPLLDVQREILEAGALSEADASFVGRAEFYELAARAQVVLRTLEPRTWANVILSKGVTPTA